MAESSEYLRREKCNVTEKKIVKYTIRIVFTKGEKYFPFNVDLKNPRY